MWQITSPKTSRGGEIGFTTLVKAEVGLDHNWFRGSRTACMMG